MYLKSIDFEQIHFHTPKNYSFLRMHKPDRFGDDLTDIRYSVDFVNKFKESINGLEMGRVVPGFRNVYPLSFNNKYIGSVEISLSVKAFINKLKNVYDVDTHFLLKKEVFEKKIFNSYLKYYETSIESDNYITLVREYDENKNIHTILRNLFRTNLVNKIEKGFKLNKTFSLDINIDSKDVKYHHKIATFLLLKNVQKQDIGYFVVYQDSKDLLDLENDFLKYIILITFINLLLFLIVYKETTKKMTFEKKVEEKTKELKELNNFLEDKIKEEVEKLRIKEQQLFEIEKMAQMGEMIGNIAHQWRQPLSVISTSASGVKLQEEFGTLNKEDLIKYMDGIVKNTQYLSETIDTFRDFIKEEKKLEEIVLQDTIKTIIEIIDASLKNNFIKLYKELNSSTPIKINTISKELSQVIINIINNSKDIIKERKISDPWIKISVKKTNSIAFIIIEDNAGGIPKDIISKIFDPYFTTKHQSIGTGLGLHMSRKIVTESLKGKLYVQNSNNGAQFFIELPINL
jgi:signal transduction histidine kinase